MVDTYGALILTHLIVGLPIIIWVMISFFEDAPADLEDAALIDGCSILRHLLAHRPPARQARRGRHRHPVLRVFLEQLSLLGDPGRPLHPRLADRRLHHDFLRGDQLGTLAATTTLITLPELLVALLAQRHIVSGLTFGAVKQ
jgi:multiple sugar transport system permease protein